MASRLSGDTRSLSTLLGEIVRDISDLIRQEIALAKTEAAEKLSNLQLGLAGLAIGGAVAFAGFIILLQACVYALGNALGPAIVDRYPALPALIVGLIVAIAGGLMIRAGIAKFSAQNLRLARTMENVRRDRSTVEEHLK